MLRMTMTLSPHRARGTAMSISNNCAGDSKSNALLKAGLRSKDVREEEKLPPGKKQNVNFKGESELQPERFQD